MTDSHPENDGHDFEQKFYMALAGNDWSGLDVNDVRKDIFDATEGVTASRLSNGGVGLMLSITPEAAKMICEGVKVWQDHNCGAAAELALYFMHVAAAVLDDVVDEIPEVKDFKPFDH